jgi:hypothetical protein
MRQCKRLHSQTVHSLDNTHKTKQKTAKKTDDTGGAAAEKALMARLNAAMAETSVL